MTQNTDKALPTERKDGNLLYAVAWQTWDKKGTVTRSEIAYLHAPDAPTARGNFFLCNAKRARAITSGYGKIISVAPTVGYWENETGITT